jgi:ATP:corrinoid adenosyltransferase
MAKKFNVQTTKQRIYQKARNAALNAGNSPVAKTADSAVHVVTTTAGAAGAAAAGAAAGAAAVGTTVAVINYLKPITTATKATGLGGIIGRQQVTTVQMGKIVAQTNMGRKAAEAAVGANSPIIAPTAAVVAAGIAAAISGGVTYVRVANAYHAAAKQAAEYHRFAAQCECDITEEEVAEND